MKDLLTGKAGVTVLEGVIALGLLALVAGGAFGVLLSSSRRSTQPDVREEMIWAVEKAHDQLKAYAGGAAKPEDGEQWNLMCISGDGNPLEEGTHPIPECLPTLCDVNNNSSFTYTVTTQDITNNTSSGDKETSAPTTAKQIEFEIICNGYQL